MSQFKDYKKLFKHIFLVSVLLVMAALPYLFSQTSFAETAGSLRDKIDAKNEEIDKLESEIKQYQGQLNNLGKQKNSLSNTIAELDLTRKKLNADISVTQNKIDRTNLKIEALGSQINVKVDSISTAKEAIGNDIKKTSELEETTLIENMLSQDDFTTVWNDIDNMMQVREKIRQNIKELQETKVELEDTRKETITAKAELTSLRTNLSDQKKIVDQNAKEKSQLLTQTKNSEASYQNLLASQTAKKAALEAEVRDYESQLKYILDPKSLPKGRPLSWPLDSVFVTQQFGKTVDSVRLYASGSHSGTDFRATTGTPVKSMADGTVTGIGNTDTTCAGASFGKWVFIVYDNGLSSTFGHLSLIKVGPGDKVHRGEIVAYSGATGHVTGPHLHVSLYAPNAASVQTLPSKACLGKTLTQPIAAINGYLDPMQYLPPYTP
jgi:murein DD-endopeptidase MepM/ murein hydrolase activator NlpD